jgi:hypothetical protein
LASPAEPVEECQRTADVAGHALPYVLWLGVRPRECHTSDDVHGPGSDEVPAKFACPDGHVIRPRDRYGHEQNGSRWPGDGGRCFVSRNRFDYPEYADRRRLYFVRQCTRLGLHFYLEIHPTRGHKPDETTGDRVARFDRNRAAIAERRSDGR